MFVLFRNEHGEVSSKSKSSNWKIVLFRFGVCLRNAFCTLFRKLKELKSLSKKWAHKKRTQEDHILKLIEEATEDYENEYKGIFSSLDHKEQITSLLAIRET